MIHRLVYTEQLPTLALVALGASETVVGVQRAFFSFSQLLKLPTLRVVGRHRKRSILVAGQVVAVLGGLPLIGFGTLAAIVPPWPVAITLASLLIVAIGIVTADTVWFPLLRGYVERERVGRFFGLVRSAWHLVLIVYFIGAQRWLAAWPGAFGTLFAAATLCGLLRIALVVRLPEAPTEHRERVRAREALALLRDDAQLQRYLCGVSLAGASRRAVVPFVIVMMRRVLGLSDADVILTTIAYFTGGFASLYVWGRTVDRLGPLPVFRSTAIGCALLYAALLGVGEGVGTVWTMVAFFFALSLLAAGFGVADTHVLFALAPAHAPTRLLVAADVTSNLIYGLAPVAAGISLDAALANGVDVLAAYRLLFVLAAVATLAALWPLRGFRC